jgi:hypothetical protein
MDYSVTVYPRQTVTVSWVADKYEWTIVACGETYHENVKVQGKKSWIIYACD